MQSRETNRIAVTKPATTSSRWRSALLVAIVGLGFAIASPAAADHYNSAQAGHPVRIVGYVLHPFGVMVDTLIFRPAHWLGSREPLKTLFGHSD